MAARPPTYPFLTSSRMLRRFVERWQAGALDHASWTHAAHVAVAAYFAFDRGADALFATMKAGIIHFNDCVGTVNGPDGGYHETLTRFWAQRISRFVREQQPASRLAAARGAVKAFGRDRELWRRSYSFDVVRDRRARREWVLPDLLPVDGDRGSE